MLERKLISENLIKYMYVKVEDPLISNDKVFCSLSVVSATEKA